MVELWLYSGRIGNCMFAHGFNRILAEELHMKCSLPKGTEITGFPIIKKDTENVLSHYDKYIVNNDYDEFPKTIISDNDNMKWFIEGHFKGKVEKNYDEIITIEKIINESDIKGKYIVTLGNFENGIQYTKYRNYLKRIFSFPEISINDFEFFKIKKNKVNDFQRIENNPINFDSSLFISLRLEDYLSPQNVSRFLGYDYFKIILEKRKYDNLYIMTNPGSIGNENQFKYLDEFKEYDPIIVRCYDPVKSIALGAKFKNIAISQSTFSWWTSFLSNANEIFYPIPLTGPFSLTDENFYFSDLRVNLPEYKYVDYKENKILNDDYFLKIEKTKKGWTN